MIWHFYDTETGLFLGKTYSGPKKFLETNTPKGALPMEGRFDHQKQRVNLENGLVEDLPQVNSKDSKREKMGVLSRIRLLESRQLRVLREMALGYDGAQQRLTEMDNQIHALRAELND